MLTGRPPFEHENPIKVIIAHASQAVTPPSSYRADIPGDLEKIVLRCLAKNPDERFQDTATLAAAFAACECAGKWTRDDARRWWTEQRKGAPHAAAVAAQSEALVLHEG